MEFETGHSRWDVAWSKPTGAPAQTLLVTVSGVGDASEMSFEDAGSGFPCEGDQLSLDVEIEVTSTDGEVVSSGPAVLRATTLEEPSLYFEHDTVSLGSQAQAAVDANVAAIEPGATVTGVTFVSGDGVVAIDADFDSPTATGQTVVYRCTYAGERNPAVTDCLTMGPP